MENTCSKVDTFPDITTIVRRNKFSALTFSEEMLNETTRRSLKVENYFKRDPVALTSIQKMKLHACRLNSIRLYFDSKSHVKPWWSSGNSIMHIFQK